MAQELAAQLIGVSSFAPPGLPSGVDRDVIGQLPPGNLSMVHIVFLIDDVTGALSTVTLETSDAATAAKFEAFDDATVSIVIRIK